MKEEFGKLGAKMEKDEEKDLGHKADDYIYKELHLSKKKFPPEPLLKGRLK